MANDSTVKAGSWGPRTVEKIVRITGDGGRLRAAPRLPRGLGRRAHHRPGRDVPRPPRRGPHLRNQVRLSGQVPQVCCLFGPSAAGGAYIPAFCDVVIMVEGNASMYLGSPRMAEMVIGEKVTLEEMGGARMHCDRQRLRRRARRRRRPSDRRGAALPRVPARSPGSDAPPAASTARSRARRQADHATSIPAEERRAYDMHEVIDALVDEARSSRSSRSSHGRSSSGSRGSTGTRSGIVANNPSTSRRRAVRRLGRQGGALHLAVRRVQRAAPVPRRRARVHDRHRRSSGRGSSGTAPR